ncbi:MAG: Thermostable carboxypeptidase 1 [Thermoleophilia bacterium]|nr:Thermostable carboxypeptidase 1 [Thermoleophilia bacterium]
MHTTAPSGNSWLIDDEVTDAHRALRGHVRDLRDLGSSMALLGWDQQTKLPPKGAAGRGRAMGLLSTVLHERRTSPELDALIAAVEDVDPDGPDARVSRRDFELSTKLPAEHVRASSEASSEGYAAWQTARENDDFEAFAPVLERLVTLAREAADHLGYEAEPYDALHDLYEQGSRAADVEPMFESLREPINRLLDQQPEPDTSVLERSWHAEGQELFGREVVARMGFDFDAGRLDVTTHPFCSGIGQFDTRLTTRYDEHWLPCSLFGTIHEAGHGIYDQSFDRLGLPATVAAAPGLGMHESQSRGYENVIGRSRPFWEFWYPRLQEVFPDATKGVDLDAFVRQVNTAKRSFIRVEADELSYNLHLAVRFELERALVNGDLAVRDLPEAWGDAFDRWFGLRPSSNREGVLQDVHWSSGLFGYFPTYTLGNVYAAQFTEAARRDIPNWDDLLRAGEFAPIVAWFDEHVYRHGSAFTGRQFVERITGGPVDVGPLVRYLEGRFG